MLTTVLPALRRSWGRFGVAACVVVVSLGPLLARTAWLQLARRPAHEARLREAQYVQVRDLPPRGAIRDAQGRVVAFTERAHDLYATAAVTPVSTDRPSLTERLAEVAPLDASADARITGRLARAAPWQAVRLLRGIDLGAPDLASSRLADVRGLQATPTWRRRYPYGALAAHALGYVSEWSSDDARRGLEAGYLAADPVGRAGVEATWERELRGVPGRHAAPRSRRIPSAPADATPAVPGKDLDLTLDMDVTGAIDRSLEGQGVRAGAAVVVEIETGRVIALLSRPAFDTDRFSTDVSVEAMDALNADPRRPQMNRVTSAPYVPGAIFKPFVALAALGASVDPSRPVTCTGHFDVGSRVYRCPAAHGPVTLDQALERSCHQWFYSAAEQTGLDAIAGVARTFGFGALSGVALPGEARGTVPTRALLTANGKRSYRVHHSLNAAIGFGALRATPLQVAMAYAALFNGGRLLRPRIVRAVRGPGGVERELGPEVRGVVDVASEPLARVRAAILARRAPGEDPRVVAGIPATASQPRLYLHDDAPAPDDAWFAGVFPPRSPRWVVVVHLDAARAASALAVAQDTARALATPEGP